MFALYFYSDDELFSIAKIPTQFKTEDEITRTLQESLDGHFDRFGNVITCNVSFDNRLLGEFGKGETEAIIEAWYS